MNLTLHVSVSVGWLGAVLGFLALALVGLRSPQAQTVRAAYVAMHLLGLYVLVPLSLLALASGVIQSLGTTWGLVRHHWVLAKLVLTGGATALLLLHHFTAVAAAARTVLAAGAGEVPQLGGLGVQLVADAALGGLVLLGATALSVFKPWGKTRWGRRHEEAQRQGVGPGPRAPAARPAPGLPRSLRIALLLAVALVAGILLLHLTGHGLGGHGP